MPCLLQECQLLSNYKEHLTADCVTEMILLNSLLILKWYLYFYFFGISNPDSYVGRHSSSVPFVSTRNDRIFLSIVSLYHNMKRRGFEVSFVMSRKGIYLLTFAAGIVFEFERKPHSIQDTPDEIFMQREEKKNLQ